MEGEESNTAVIQTGCNQGRATEYDNVSIIYSHEKYDPSDDRGMPVTLKRDICPKPGK